MQLFKPDDAKTNHSDNLFSFVSTSAPEKGNTNAMCNGPVTSEASSLTYSSNVHTIVKKDPDSLVMNIKKLPKTYAVNAQSDRVPDVNSHEVIQTANDISEIDLDSSKKTVPKIVISNNRVTTKSPDKHVTPANGLNTTFVKCKDNEGRVLLVPQSSLTFKAPPNVKLNNISGANSSITTSAHPTAENSVSKTVPSYILKVVPNQNSGQNQVFLIPLSEKKAKSTFNKCGIKSQTHVVQETKDTTETTSKCVSQMEKNPRLLTRFELDSIK